MYRPNQRESLERVKILFKRLEDNSVPLGTGEEVVAFPAEDRSSANRFEIYFMRAIRGWAVRRPPNTLRVSLAVLVRIRTFAVMPGNSFRATSCPLDTLVLKSA